MEVVKLFCNGRRLQHAPAGAGVKSFQKRGVNMFEIKGELRKKKQFTCAETTGNLQPTSHQKLNGALRLNVATTRRCRRVSGNVWLKDNQSVCTSCDLVCVFISVPKKGSIISSRPRCHAAGTADAGNMYTKVSIWSCVNCGGGEIIL